MTITFSISVKETTVDFFFFFLGNPTYKGCYYLKQDAILAYSEILRAFS